MNNNFFSFWLLFLSLPALAALPETTPIPYHFNPVTIQKLSNMDTWTKLVVYEDSDTLGSEVESAILTKDFFLAPNGHNNPEAELLATINAFSEPVSTDPNDHAQCHFPARYH